MLVLQGKILCLHACNFGGLMTGTDGHHCNFRTRLVESEILGISDEDQRGWLLAAMKEYEKGQLPAGKVKPIGDGILEITVNRGGVFLRCLFFHPKPFIAVALKVYMKKTNKLPKQVHKVAQERMREWNDRDKA